MQSFHDLFVVKSGERQTLKQIGNAVPPLMGRALASAAAKAIDAATEQRITPMTDVDNPREHETVSDLTVVGV